MKTDISKITFANINLKSLLHNLKLVKKANAKAEIIAIVKANAYGHGAVEVARYLAKHGVGNFGVATIEEGESLRKHKVKEKIFLLAGSGFTEQIKRLVTADLTPLVSSLNELKQITHFLKKQKKNKPLAFHLDLDTGMSRAGVFVGNDAKENLDPILDYLKKHQKFLKLTGLSTHFASAENTNDAFNKKQLKKFYQALDFVDESGFKNIAVHIANSSAVFNKTLNQQKRLKRRPILIRPGLCLYGYNLLETKSKKAQPKPILSWHAPITLVKTISKGTHVGYNYTWKAPRTTELALVRVGYADGLNRHLSNKGYVLLHGLKAPIVGRVSMDLITIDITNISKKLGENSCGPGNFVTLIGQEGKNQITAQTMADLSQTIVYEILTNISARVPRFYEK